MNMDDIRQGFNSFLGSVTEGWQHLRQSAASALTRFKPKEQTNLPAKDAVDDMFYIPSGTWSMLGGNLFEDDKRVVVQMEVPGMEKQDLEIEVQDNMLVVSGEKHFERESTEGRYRVLQCAYGNFQRAMPLPAAVLIDQAKATYKNGVLRVELPKASIGAPRKMNIKVD
ncbi:MAG: heat-shock protein Hsp20 [Burkholderiales bacterium RIFCSPLOWO2_02_FULL_57_36]|nr:MAG: heat-shock protein Hsp20 [Burkholderiales bacterium RIFCSPLOWO2_02_FULL_57_36]